MTRRLSPAGQSVIGMLTLCSVPASSMMMKRRVLRFFTSCRLFSQMCSSRICTRELLVSSPPAQRGSISKEIEPAAPST
ncbi:hypothetical protein D3C83_164900 [compost metagenome]